ncbi:MAG: hypothetical protein AAGC56_02055 [Pseudomonadota bacterium]
MAKAREGRRRPTGPMGWIIRVFNRSRGITRILLSVVIAFLSLFFFVQFLMAPLTFLAFLNDLYPLPPTLESIALWYDGEVAPRITFVFDAFFGAYSSGLVFVEGQLERLINNELEGYAIGLRFIDWEIGILSAAVARLQALSGDVKVSFSAFISLSILSLGLNPVVRLLVSFLPGDARRDLENGASALSVAGVRLGFSEADASASEPAAKPKSRREGLIGALLLVAWHPAYIVVFTVLAYFLAVVLRALLSSLLIIFGAVLINLIALTGALVVATPIVIHVLALYQAVDRRRVLPVRSAIYYRNFLFLIALNVGLVVVLAIVLNRWAAWIG